MYKCDCCKKINKDVKTNILRENCHCMGGNIGHNNNCEIIKVFSCCGDRECKRKLVNFYSITNGTDAFTPPVDNSSFSDNQGLYSIRDLSIMLSK